MFLVLTSKPETSPPSLRAVTPTLLAIQLVVLFINQNGTYRIIIIHSDGSFTRAVITGRRIVLRSTHIFNLSYTPKVNLNTILVHAFGLDFYHHEA
jgi:hypothetical protein